MIDTLTEWLVTFGLMGVSAAGAYLLGRPRKSHVDAVLAAARKEAALEAREETLKVRERLDEEAQAQRRALEALQSRLSDRESQLEERRAKLNDREEGLIEMERSLNAKEAALSSRQAAVEEELQRVAGLDRKAAKETYLRRIESEFRDIATQRAKSLEQSIVGDVERRARDLGLEVMQRNAVAYVTEATATVVQLPNEDMKGRLIGREGRNIRTFEQVTGVDLIIDDTPEAVVLSCFDPVRREVARLALLNLMLDGRIHPGRIQELHERAQEEIERTMHESGERAAERAQVNGLAPGVVDALGRLRFRTSYGQNVLDHSVEVSRMAALMAAELGCNVEVAKRAGLLHDVGKGLDDTYGGPHAAAGAEFLRQCGERESVVHAIAAHHSEVVPATPEAALIIVADALSAARPGARRENLESHVQRLKALEEIANAFPGVERSYAIQAGREVRVLVRPQQVDDLGARKLAAEVARRIESELEYPGQIRVTVVREMRVSEVAN